MRSFHLLFIVIAHQLNICHLATLPFDGNLQEQLLVEQPLQPEILKSELLMPEIVLTPEELNQVMILQKSQEKTYGEKYEQADADQAGQKYQSSADEQRYNYDQDDRSYNQDGPSYNQDDRGYNQDGPSYRHEDGSYDRNHGAPGSYDYRDGNPDDRGYDGPNPGINYNEPGPGGQYDEPPSSYNENYDSHPPSYGGNYNENPQESDDSRYPPGHDAYNPPSGHFVGNYNDAPKTGNQQHSDYQSYDQPTQYYNDGPDDRGFHEEPHYRYRIVGTRDEESANEYPNRLNYGPGDHGGEHYSNYEKNTHNPPDGYEEFYEYRDAGRGHRPNSHYENYGHEYRYESGYIPDSYRPNFHHNPHHDHHQQPYGDYSHKVTVYKKVPRAPAAVAGRKVAPVKKLRGKQETTPRPGTVSGGRSRIKSYFTSAPNKPR